MDFFKAGTKLIEKGEPLNLKRIWIVIGVLPRLYNGKLEDAMYIYRMNGVKNYDNTYFFKHELDELEEITDDQIAQARFEQ